LGSFYNSLVNTIGSVDYLIEKNQEIIEKIKKFLINKFLILTNHYERIKMSLVDYCSICKSGIKRFDNEKIYLDTAAVSDDNIIDESYRITFSDRPSRANMQPEENTFWFAKLKDSPKYVLVKSESTRILDTMILSTGFMGIKSDRFALNYLYCLFTSDEFINQKDLLSNGATMQGINNSVVMPRNKYLCLIISKAYLFLIKFVFAII